MSNAGQLWSAVQQWGKEVTPGVAVAATRKMYLREPMLSRERAPRVHRFATGRRDNVGAVTLGPVAAGGSVAMPVSADELLEFFEIGARGGVSPTTPSGATNARLYTYTPGDLASATIEWDDGARVWQGKGQRINQLTIAGAVGEENVATGDLFGTDVVPLGSLTGALSDRNPTFMEGWRTRFYMAPLGTDPFSTPMPGLLRNWSIALNNNLDRAYTADNTLAANRVTAGDLDTTGQFTFDAYSQRAKTEYDYWDAETPRCAGVEFLGPADEIEAGANEVQTMNTSGTPTSGNIVSSVLGQQFTVAFDATAAQVKTAIDTALSVFGPDHTVTVTGGPMTTTGAVNIAFTGAGVSGRDIPQISAVSNTLTGGTAPAPVYATTTPGRSGRKYVRITLPGAWTAVNLGGNANGIRTYEFSMQGMYDSVLAAMIRYQLQTSRTSVF